MIYIMCVVLGVLLTFLTVAIQQSISFRMNHGKKVFAGRRHAGYVVTCRFNGSKKYFYIDEYLELSKDHYFTRNEAIEACREAFAKDRPKQSVFARVA